LTPDKPGKYFIMISIGTGWLPPGMNSRLKAMEIY